MINNDLLFKETLGHLHIIEEKYGSISHVPENDPDFQALIKIYPRKNGSSKMDIQDRIIKYATQGYPISYISNHSGKSRTWIYQFLRRKRIRLKSTFGFLIVDPDGNQTYATGLQHFISVYFHRLVTYDTRAFLVNRGYKIIRKYFVWHWIPDGSHYLLGYMSKPAIKNGDDSYIYRGSAHNL